MMTIDEAVLFLRQDARYTTLVHDAYLGADTYDSAVRFTASGEFAEVLRLIGDVRGKIVLDIGAGTAIASYAFAQAGAKHVYALEPDESEFVGRGAAGRITNDLPITLIDGFADAIPLPDASVDIVYMRQVMHHIPDLNAAMHDIARVLKLGGLFLACREHVVDNDAQKQIFLQNHPMHQLTGTENAYSLEEYSQAITKNGLRLQRVFRPWDTVINTFPLLSQPAELDRFFHEKLKEKLGVLGRIASVLPFSSRIVKEQYNRLRTPGRLYTFHAVKQS